MVEKEKYLQLFPVTPFRVNGLFRFLLLVFVLLFLPHFAAAPAALRVI
jgi:hypothetical protein